MDDESFFDLRRAARTSPRGRPRAGRVELGVEERDAPLDSAPEGLEPQLRDGRILEGPVGAALGGDIYAFLRELPALAGEPLVVSDAARS